MNCAFDRQNPTHTPIWTSFNIHLCFFFSRGEPSGELDHRTVSPEVIYDDVPYEDLSPEGQTYTVIVLLLHASECACEFHARMLSYTCLLSVSVDLIYEDVQREEGLHGPNHDWSSSEFESYDEQSDSERATTRSKVCVCKDHLLIIWFMSRHIDTFLTPTAGR